MIPRVYIVSCIFRNQKPIRIIETSVRGRHGGRPIHVGRRRLHPGLVERRRGGEVGVRRRARVRCVGGDRVGGGAGAGDGEGRGGWGEVGERRGRGEPAIAGVGHRRLGRRAAGAGFAVACEEEGKSHLAAIL